MATESIKESIPNSLTVARILMIPVFAYLYLFLDDYKWLAAVFFAFAALTDWLDGFIARRFSWTSRFGEILDPVADKLVVLSALVILIGSYGTVWLTLPGIIIVCRELLISALREWMADLGVGMKLNVSLLARIKTGVQMAAITILLANPPDLTRPWAIAGLLLVYAATLLTIWSMLAYLRRAWNSINS